MERIFNASPKEMKKVWTETFNRKKIDKGPKTYRMNLSQTTVCSRRESITLLWNKPPVFPFIRDGHDRGMFLPPYTMSAPIKKKKKRDNHYALALPWGKISSQEFVGGCSLSLSLCATRSWEHPREDDRLSTGGEGADATTDDLHASHEPNKEKHSRRRVGLSCSLFVLFFFRFNLGYIFFSLTLKHSYD